MDTKKLSPYTLAIMKLAMYQNRHGGKKPARIFVSTGTFWEITKGIKMDMQNVVTGEHKLFGIPVSIFTGDECPGFYLSDEEGAS